MDGTQLLSFGREVVGRKGGEGEREGGGEGKKGGTEVREKIRKKYRGKGLGLVVQKKLPPLI